MSLCNIKSITSFVSNRLGVTLLQGTGLRCLLPLATTTNAQIVKHRHTKHYDPRFKDLRRAKVIKIKLPKFNEDEDDLLPSEIRAKMKERGLVPPRKWSKPLCVSCTGGIFEPYVPPEGDGKMSAISTQGAKQKFEFVGKKTKSYLEVRKLRQYEDDFEFQYFCEDAEEIYKKAHECLANNNLSELEKYVTERAYPEITHNTKSKTIRWKYIKQLELPRVVHARCTSLITKENVFAQLTVRFHSQQSLAIYDRFGRLMYGSEIIAKDVLEYVVFEKHLANAYGTWRIHAKIIPDWAPPQDSVKRTFIKDREERVDAPPLVEASEKEIETNSTPNKSEIVSTPPV